MKKFNRPTFYKPPVLQKTATEQQIEKEPRKSHPWRIAITAFLLGMALEAGMMTYIARKALPVLWWTIQHPEEAKWAMDRYSVIQKAGHVLYFEDSISGVTIVKPQVQTPTPTVWGTP